MNENRLIKENIKTLRLLTESIDRQSIIDAIEGNRVVYIYYQGDETVNRGYRTIEPYTLGTHKSTGNLLLRAYQQAGASDTKGTAKRENDEIPGWRLFKVDGISSFMPVQGNNSRFKDSLTPRKGYNPNDSALNVIATHDSEGIKTIDNKGAESIEEPNYQSNDKSVFDKQTSAFKDFIRDNNTFQFKKSLADLFGRVKFSRKQNPNNYIVVVNPNGELEYKPKNWSERLEPNKIVGNLNDLFNKVSGYQNASQSQFEDFQNELNKSGSLLGGNRRRPIDRSFFNTEYNNFEKSLQNQ